MAMTVVLFPVSQAEPKLKPATLEELARLGVTDVALLRDTIVAGLVLEGWAFDSRNTRRAASAVVGADSDLRVLEPLVHMAVSSAARQEVSDER